MTIEITTKLVPDEYEEHELLDENWQFSFRNERGAIPVQRYDTGERVYYKLIDGTSKFFGLCYDIRNDEFEEYQRQVAKLSYDYDSIKAYLEIKVEVNGITLIKETVFVDYFHATQIEDGALKWEQMEALARTQHANIQEIEGRIHYIVTNMFQSLMSTVTLETNPNRKITLIKFIRDFVWEGCQLIEAKQYYELSEANDRLIEVTLSGSKLEKALEFIKHNRLDYTLS